MKFDGRSVSVHDRATRRHNASCEHSPSNQGLTVRPCWSLTGGCCAERPSSGPSHQLSNWLYGSVPRGDVVLVGFRPVVASDRTVLRESGWHRLNDVRPAHRHGRVETAAPGDTGCSQSDRSREYRHRGHSPARIPRLPSVGYLAFRGGTQKREKQSSKRVFRPKNSTISRFPVAARDLCAADCPGKLPGASESCRPPGDRPSALMRTCCAPLNRMRMERGSAPGASTKSYSNWLRCRNRPDRRQDRPTRTARAQSSAHPSASGRARR